MTLTDFLLARIAEDAEQAAKAVGRGIMWPRLSDGVAAHDVEAGWHVFRWHPARVLAECEAKRRIVEMAQLDGLAMYERIQAEADPVDAEDFAGGAEWAIVHTLRLLAYPYADHPDFDESWRP